MAGLRRERGHGAPVCTRALAGLQPAGVREPASMVPVTAGPVLQMSPRRGGFGIHLTYTQYVDAAHGVAVDSGLIETGNGRSVTTSSAPSIPAPRQSRHVSAAEPPRSRYPGLLLLHRTHKRASLPDVGAARAGAGYRSIRPNRATTTAQIRPYRHDPCKVNRSLR